MGTITETYDHHRLHFPEKTAIQTPHHKVTYKTWQEQVWKTANWLDSLSVSNQTLGILLPNGIPFLQLFTGAAAAGWTTVLFDGKWTLTECQKRLSLARPSILVTTKEFYPKIKHLHSNVLIWEECEDSIQEASPLKMELETADLPFYMGFTSGTTGDPKAFIRAHQSWTTSFHCTRLDFKINEQDAVLIPGSLIHSHFLYGAISTLFLGGTVYLMDKFIPKQAISILSEKPISVVYVVPTMIASFLREKEQIGKPLKIISSGAKWESHLKQQIHKIFPSMSMYEFYGASELSFVTFLRDEDNRRKPDSVGKACQQVELQIRRPDMTKAKPYEQGKIYVKSPMVFLGYLNSTYRVGQQYSVHTIEDENGWITVDDMGYLDEEGFLYLSGREKNMILYGGINIFPEEIEQVLRSHKAVEEAAVVGIPDPHWGQIAVAVVKGTASQIDLKRLCKNKLSSYKIPRKWLFVDEMPYTTSGKIARAQLRKLLESKVNTY